MEELKDPTPEYVCKCVEAILRIYEDKDLDDTSMGNRLRSDVQQLFVAIVQEGDINDPFSLVVSWNERYMGANFSYTLPDGTEVNHASVSMLREEWIIINARKRAKQQREEKEFAKMVDEIRNLPGPVVSTGWPAVDNAVDQMAFYNEVKKQPPYKLDDVIDVIPWEKKRSMTIAELHAQNFGPDDPGMNALRERVAVFENNKAFDRAMKGV